MESSNAELTVMVVGHMFRSCDRLSVPLVEAPLSMMQSAESSWIRFMVCLRLTWKRLIVASSSLGDFCGTSRGVVLVRDVLDDRTGDIRVSSHSSVIMRWGLLCFRLRMFCCGERSFFLNDAGEERMTTAELSVAPGEVHSYGMAALMSEGADASLIPRCVSLRGTYFQS